MLQIERIIDGTVESSQNVIFDTSLISNNDIEYDSTTGIITIQKIGVYELEWWIATQTSTSTNGAGFALKSSQGDNIIGNSPIKTGEVVGIGIIKVLTVPVTIELKNNSNTAIYYSTIVPIKASLVITRKDDSITTVSMPYIAAQLREGQLFQPGIGVLFDEISQTGDTIVMSDVEPDGYTLFSATEDGMYEFNICLQIQSTYEGIANFYFDLHQNTGVPIERISQSVAGEYATVYYSKVFNLQTGNGLYLMISPMNGNDTQGANVKMEITIKQLQPL